MLRKEIKAAKFENERSSYQNFVKSLTVLRPERSRSNNRADSSISVERKSDLEVRKSLNYDKSYPQDSPRKPEPDCDYGIHKIQRP